MIALDLTKQEVEAPPRKKRKYVRRKPLKSAAPAPPPPPPVLEEEESSDNDSDDSSDEEEDTSMEPPTDPDTALEPGHSHLTTVHWDPNGENGQTIIGWKIRVSDDKTGDWKEGRVVFYDPCTHKHRIQFVNEPRQCDKVDKDNCAWLHLRMEDGVQMATKLVWAHVKGYAWWPAMVMESDVSRVREGYVSVEFFGSTSEVATLRNSPECLRPFVHGQVDPVIAKNKKKRNAPAVLLGMQEEQAILGTRNAAAKQYAHYAFQMCQPMTPKTREFLGCRVQLFRNDVNYPYGDTLRAKVRQYSASQKKWLVTFELSDSSNKKYDAAWINLAAKEHKVRILEKFHHNMTQMSDLELLPFLVGFQAPYKNDDPTTAPASIKSSSSSSSSSSPSSNKKDPPEHSDAYFAKAFEQRCKGCVDYWRKDDDQKKIQCHICQGTFHLGCCDPPVSPDKFAKLAQDYVCSKCVSCRGCYQKDICCGSHPHPIPPTLSFPDGETLELCTMCVKAYEKGQYCPNCAHSWDDDHFQLVQQQIRWQQAHRPKKRGRKKKYPDDREDNDPAYSFTAPATIPNEGPFPEHALVNPTWYYPETAKWGFTEVDMLTCDSCKLWVHAGCAGVNEEEYDETSKGKHPIYSKEFLCRVCCRKRCNDIIQKLQQEDSMFLFFEPVTDKVAPNYLDVIKQPMDLQTMLIRAEREEYQNYAWVREMFELMVLNALTFNRFHTTFWNEAKRYHKACLTNVFQKMGKAAPPGKYEAAIQKNLQQAKAAKKMEEDRIQEDRSTEKKDLVAGAKVATIKLPSLRDQPPDLASCLPYQEVKLRPVDAYFCGWMDCCFTCGSSGASDTMIFCVDCGEAFHSFCVNAPIHSMDISSAAGWRCPNCKICEISGDQPQDELKMLFCEMCDRAFSLDLLDPPLPAAPPGLWICGQCVDCHKCRNSLEPRGASLKYWSRDPHLCYRCGGCDGLVDHHKKGRKCPVCSGIWRDDDADLAQCADCETKVHARCDSRASAYLKKLKDNETEDGDNQDKKKAKKVRFTGFTFGMVLLLELFFCV